MRIGIVRFQANNRNIMRTYLYILCSFILTFTLFSCTSEVQEREEGEAFECPLVVNGGVQMYADVSTRAAISWQTSSRIYIRLSSSVYGYAVYNGNTRTWNAYLNATPNETTGGNAYVYYFDNATYGSTYTSLTCHSGVYSDLYASYTYSKSAGMVLNTGVKPSYGRIRFKGSNGQSITLSGITYKTRYTYSSDTYSSSSSTLSLTVGSDGYTDYVYGEFTDASMRKLTVTTGGVTYTTYCSSSMYKAGQSGYLNIPTTSAHTGWLSDRDGESDISIGDFDSDVCWDKGDSQVADVDLDGFSSEECWDPSLSQTINVSLDDFSSEEDWSAKGSSAEVKLTNMLVISDGYCFDYEYSEDASNFIVYRFTSSSSYYNASDKDIADYIEKYGGLNDVEEYKANNYYTYYFDQTPGTNYLLCVLAFDKNGNRGVFNKYKIQTPSTSYQPIASLGTWSYASSQWKIGVTMNSYCSSYYHICYSGTTVSEWYNISLAHNIRNFYINKGDTSHKGTNNELYYTIGSTTPAIIATWGVSSSGDLSGVVTSKGNSYYNSKYPSAKRRSNSMNANDNCRSVSKYANLDDVQIYYISNE